MGDVDSQALSEVPLGEGDPCPQDFFPEQHDTDYGKDPGGLSPREIDRSHQGVDRVDSPVQHNGIDLGQKRTDQGQEKGDGDKEAVRLDVGQYFLEKVD